jgi:hypothetical protein
MSIDSSVLSAMDLYYYQQVARIVQKGSFFSLLFTSCRVLHRWLQSVQDLGDFNPQAVQSPS